MESFKERACVVPGRTILGLLSIALGLCISSSARAQTPTLSSSLTPPAICSGQSFDYIPTSSSPAVGFTWTMVPTAGIFGLPGVPTNGQGAISLVLGNSTTSPIPVTFQVTLTGAGATNTQDVVVVVNPPPSPRFTVTGGPQCLIGNSFGFTNTSVIGSGTMTYAWSMGDGANSTLTNVTHSYASAGNYSVRLIATSNFGCAAAVVHSVTVYAEAVPDFTYTLQPPYTTNAYQFNNTSRGGVSYSWNFGDGSPLSAATNPAHTYASAGTYPVTLTITNANGCAATVTENITTPAIAPAGTVAFWIGSAAGANDVTGQCQGTTFFFTDKTIPKLGATISNIAWNFGDGSPIVNVPGTVPTVSHIYAAAGTHTVFEVVTFTGGGGGTGKASQTVNVYPSPPVTLRPNNLAVLCAGATSNPIYFQPTNDGLAFSWVISNPAVGASSGSGSYFPSFTSVNNGASPVTSNVQINIVSPYGCAIPSQNLTITVNPIPQMSSLLPPIEVCGGSQITEPAFGATLAGTTFTWTNSNPLTGLAATGTGDVAPFTGTNFAPIPSPSSLTVTPVLGGCKGTPLTTIFTVDPVPALDSPLTGYSQCSGATFAFTAGSLTTGAVINWSRATVPGIVQVASSGANNISEVLTSNTALPTTVTYVYNLQAGNCAQNQDVTVQVQPIPQLSGPPDTALCNGVPLVYTPASATPGTTFSWTRAAVPGISNPAGSGTPDINETLTSTSPGAPVSAVYVYNLSAAGCTNTQNLTLTLNPVPVLTLPAPGSQELCSGLTTTAIAYGITPAGTSYTWTNTNLAIGLPASGTGTIPPFQVTNTGTVTLSGNIQVTAQTAAGCTAGPVAPYVVTVDPAPIAGITAASGSVWCPGVALPLTGTGGNTYQWSLDDKVLTGATNAVLQAADSGQYAVTAFNTYGCADSAQAAVTIFPRASAGFTYTSSCVSKPVIFANTSTEAGGYAVNYLWSDNAGNSSTVFSPTFTYPQPGTFAVTLVVTPQACASQGDTIIESVPITQPIPSLRLPDEFVESAGNVPISARTFENALYLWSPGSGLSDPTAITPLANLTAGQVFLIAMTFPTGCVTTDTLQVDIIPKNTVYIPSAFTPNGDGKNDLFVIAGLNNYPGSAFAVYDRWGKQVYFSGNYQNNWDGAGLQQGTYIYLLQVKLPDGSKIYRGTIIIIR